MILRQQLKALWKAQLVHSPHIGADNAEYRVNAKSVPHHAGAEPAEIRGVCEIHVAALHKLVLLMVVEKPECEGLGFSGGELWGMEADRLKLAKSAPSRRGVHPKMNVRGARFPANHQVLIDMGQGMRIGLMGKFLNVGWR
jgi:hypothetical protein